MTMDFSFRLSCSSEMLLHHRVAYSNVETSTHKKKNNMEEGKYIRKNNKTYKESGTRQTHWKCQVQKVELD
jgi:hypothetical protein